MSESLPKICALQPLVMEVEPGVHFWCACGLSSHPPYCDGSHKGTGLQPVRHEVKEKSRIAWCQCKHSNKAPLCDGTHRTLEA